ncbi:hypothetical protein ACS0TY_025402 [Phlomoides rotata]
MGKRGIPAGTDSPAGRGMGNNFSPFGSWGRGRGIPDFAGTGNVPPAPPRPVAKPLPCCSLWSDDDTDYETVDQYARGYEHGPESRRYNQLLS